MEELDQVDENDSIIGVTDKHAAHEKNLIHRVSAVYVFTSSGELIVQIHKDSGGLYDHSVGGHVKKGESYEAAAHREAEEELGIKQDLNHVVTFFGDDGVRAHMYSVFECVASESWKFIPNDEVEELATMKIEAVLKLTRDNPEKFTRGFILTIGQYCKAKEPESQNPF